MSDRLPVNAIDPVGATDGQGPVYDAALGRVIWADPPAGGGAVAVEDEGVETVAAASRLNFAGAGVTVTDAGSGEATVTIPGGSSGTETFADAVAALPSKVHRWSFTEASGTTVADSIGSLNLAMSGTYTRGVSSLTGTGTTFAGGARASSSGIGSIPAGSNSRCIIVIAKSDGGTAGRVMAGYGAAGTNNLWFAGFLNASGVDNQLGLLVWGANDHLVTGAGGSQSEWVMYAIGVSNTTNIRTHLYLNGQTWAKSASGLNTSSAGNFYVGQWGGDSSGQFFGTMDEVIVCNTWPGKRALDRIYRALPTV